MPKNSIVRNEQTSTKSSNKTAPSRATAGANKAGGAQVSQLQKNATQPAQSHAPKSNLNDSEQMKFELFASTMCKSHSKIEPDDGVK